jgi:hypothetical protein
MEQILQPTLQYAGFGLNAGLYYRTPADSKDSRFPP